MGRGGPRKTATQNQGDSTTNKEPDEATQRQRSDTEGAFTREEMSSIPFSLALILDSTFDRHMCISSCRSFALNNCRVRQVWIMDDASIHCDPNITYDLRSLGIQVILYYNILPYCPFFGELWFPRKDFIHFKNNVAFRIKM